MPLKVAFNNQVHKISKTPTSYKALTETISYLFEGQLPERWTLQYIDSDGDTIMLCEENDYRNLVEDEFETSAKAVKILIFPLPGLPVSASQNISKQREPEVIEKEEKLQEETKVEEQVVEPTVVDNVTEVANPIETLSENQQEDVINNEPVVEESKQEVVTNEDLTGRKTENKVNRPKVHWRKILKKLAKANLSQERRERLQARFDQLQAELTEDERATLQKKKEKFLQKQAQFEVKRKAELKDLVTDLIYEQLPIIASLTKEFVQQHPASNPEQPERQPQAPSKPIHEHVSCDGCGVHPIFGVRYKCSVCPNFDYCEACENSLNHPHVFLKIKKPETFSPFHRRPFHCGFPRGGCRRGESRQNQRPNHDSWRNFGPAGGVEDLFRAFFGKPANNQGENSGKANPERENLHKAAKESYENLPPFLRDTLNGVFGGFQEMFLNPKQENATEETKSEEQNTKNSQSDSTGENKEKNSMFEGTDLKELFDIIAQTVDFPISFEDLLGNLHL